MTPVRTLVLDEISATYRDGGAELLALDSISLHVDTEEFVAIIGPSGSGKSTLLDIVSGLFGETSGFVFLNGEMRTLSDRLGRTSYMRQRDLLLPWRTAVANAAVGLEAHGVGKREARARASMRFREFGLAGFEQAWPAQLSGGMRQRIAFLRTVLADPDLLLLDEPFGALDAMNRHVMQSWLAEHWEREKRSVLLVTHDVDEAIFLADRVLVFSARPGTIVHEEVIDLPRPRTRRLLASPVLLKHRESLLAALGLLESGGS